MDRACRTDRTESVVTDHWRLVPMLPPLPHCPCGAVAYIRSLDDNVDYCFHCFAALPPVTDGAA